MSLRRYYEDPHENATSVGCSEKPIIDVVIQMLEDYAGQYSNLIDVGCGANLDYNLPSIKRGVEVTGVDFSYNFLRLAPRQPNLFLIQSDAEELGVASGLFDAAVCSESAEHIPDDYKVVSEIARVLKPNGLLFFTVPNIHNAYYLLERLKGHKITVDFFDHGHLREYTRAMVNKLIKPHFEILQFYPVPFQWSGKVGGKIDWLISKHIFTIFSKSVALVARKKPEHQGNSVSNS
jgi:2-polyprenyl-3-methyl-5-hydroxy-6-metoxy-1,4-benzoquinol methylase